MLQLQNTLFLPEAEVPVSNPQWTELFVKFYKTQPSYHAILGAETMFALAQKYDPESYTPDAPVKMMDTAAKALNEKIKIKMIEFSSGKQ